MIKEEKKPRISGLDLEFPPWVPMEFKDQTETYFESMKKLNGNGLNPTINCSSLLVTKLDIGEVFGLKRTSFKVTNPHLHPETKQNLLKLCW